MHNIVMNSYPLNVDREQVQKHWDEYAAREDWQEGCTGLYRPIRWIEDEISESYEEAEERISQIDHGDYDQLAVKFKEYKKGNSKKIEILAARLEEVRQGLRKRESVIHYSSDNVASEYVGCKHCGSRIATKYIKSNRCPVCGADLRPATVLNRIDIAKQRIAQLENQIKAEERKNGKYEVKWLVKIEYHT